jgi:hypothetical protein
LEYDAIIKAEVQIVIGIRPLASGADLHVDFLGFYIE